MHFSSPPYVLHAHHHIIVDLIILIIYEKEHTLWSSSMYNSVHLIVGTFIGSTYDVTTNYLHNCIMLSTATGPINYNHSP
jgi:hypothetical protein